MPSRSISRQEFLVLTITVGTAAFAGCSDDPASPPATGGSGGSGTGTGGGGSGTTGGGGTATGGSGGAATGGGGSGGAATGGGGAGGGGGGGGMCGTANIAHTACSSGCQHTHVEDAVKAMLVMNLKAHINGAMATMAFTLPSAGPNGGHTHTLTFTAQQITTLKGGGMVTGVVSSNDGNHTHTYTVSCVA